MSGNNPSVKTWRATSGTSALTSSGVTQVVASGGTGVKHYVTDIQVVNSGASADAMVSLLDGASTVIWTTFCPATGAGLQAVPVNVSFSTPLQCTASTILNLKASASSSILYNVQGFDAP